jgi:predicted DNA-binding protein (UPF0251 family)
MVDFTYEEKERIRLIDELRIKFNETWCIQRVGLQMLG